LILRFLAVLAALALLPLAGHADTSPPQAYQGPAVTGIVVYKAKHRMYLLHGNKPLKIFKIHLGSDSQGPKHFLGDGKTPEGAYRITFRNPNSAYHLALEISYPDAADQAYAKAHDRNPGGEIFIHGQAPTWRLKWDWTAGCIALSNRDMDVVYAMVRSGTPIWIEP